MPCASNYGNYSVLSQYYRSELYIKQLNYFRDLLIVRYRYIISPLLSFYALDVPHNRRTGAIRRRRMRMNLNSLTRKDLMQLADSSAVFHRGEEYYRSGAI